MAARNCNTQNEKLQNQVATYGPEYGWLLDRFGPPPGIPRARKLELGVQLIFCPLINFTIGSVNLKQAVVESEKHDILFVDRMTDRQYTYAVRNMPQLESDSLMASEAERRRTFAHWPKESIVKAYDCAKEGFYYTGNADRVQCAFCGGVISNWQRGDVPGIMHRTRSKYCNMVQSK